MQNALVVGRSDLAGEDCTKSGIITPKQYIFNVDGATFVNFDGDCTALAACSQCKPDQGGFHHQFRGIVYDNSPNKVGGGLTSWSRRGKARRWLASYQTAIVN